MVDKGMNGRAPLNEHQARWLRVTFDRIDRLLAEIEAILDEPSTTVAFPRYIADISPEQRQGIDDYLVRVREELIESLAGLGIAPEPPSIPASRAIRVALISIDDAAEELKPRRMRRWGSLSEAVVTDLNEAAMDLQSLVRELGCFLADGSSPDAPTSEAPMDSPEDERAP